MTRPLRVRSLPLALVVVALACIATLLTMPPGHRAGADQSSSTTTTAPNGDSDDPCRLSVQDPDLTSTTTTSTSTSSTSTTTTTPGGPVECDSPELPLPDGSSPPPESTTTTTPPDHSDGAPPPSDGSDGRERSGDSDRSGRSTGDTRETPQSQQPGTVDGRELASGGSEGRFDGPPIDDVVGPTTPTGALLPLPSSVSTYTARPGLRSTADILDRLGSGLSSRQLGQIFSPFPVAGAANYSDDWGAPRHGPGTIARTHKGTDIFAARGTPVVASLDGVVENMQTNTGLGGTSLRVLGSDGTYHYFAHLAQHAAGITNGDPVRPGDVIGFVGNTGNARSTPPHLHFEIHPLGGEAVPPIPYLDAWLEVVRQRVGSDLVGGFAQGRNATGIPDDYYQSIGTAAPRLGPSYESGQMLSAIRATAYRDPSTAAPLGYLLLFAVGAWMWRARAQRRRTEVLRRPVVRAAPFTPFSLIDGSR